MIINIIKIALKFIGIIFIICIFYIIYFINIDYSKLERSLEKKDTDSITVIDLEHNTTRETTNPETFICSKNIYLKLKIRALIFNDKNAAYYLNRCFRYYQFDDKKLSWLIYSLGLGSKKAEQQFIKDAENIEYYINERGCLLSNDENSFYCKNHKKDFNRLIRFHRSHAPSRGNAHPIPKPINQTNSK